MHSAILNIITGSVMFVIAALALKRTFFQPEFFDKRYNPSRFSSPFGRVVYGMAAGFFTLGGLIIIYFGFK